MRVNLKHIKAHPDQAIMSQNAELGLVHFSLRYLDLLHTIETEVDDHCVAVVDQIFVSGEAHRTARMN